jgi:hypothetical protein
MGRAVARQRPVALDAPDSPIGRRIGWLAESLVDEIAGGQAMGPPSDRAAGPR